MIDLEELWLELYRFVAIKKEHPWLEVKNTFWEAPSIKLTKTYLVSNWLSGDDDWETCYIESDSNKCHILAECLVYVTDKLRNGDWTY